MNLTAATPQSPQLLWAFPQPCAWTLQLSIKNFNREKAFQPHVDREGTPLRYQSEGLTPVNISLHLLSQIIPRKGCLGMFPRRYFSLSYTKSSQLLVAFWSQELQPHTINQAGRDPKRFQAETPDCSTVRSHLWV